MNKEQAQKLIERLSGNNKDMFLGDVLELITKLPLRPTADPTAKKYILYKTEINLTVLYWSAFGLNKSLQTILDEAKCEEKIQFCCKQHMRSSHLKNGELFLTARRLGKNHKMDIAVTSHLKSTALELFQLLETLFPNNKPNDTKNEEK